jgi:arginine/lysine/ornithine decarboxylase
MPLLSSKSVDEKINHFFFNWLPSGDRAENFFGNIILRLKYTILKDLLDNKGIIKETSNSLRNHLT